MTYIYIYIYSYDGEMKECGDGKKETGNREHAQGKKQ